MDCFGLNMPTQSKCIQSKRLRCKSFSLQVKAHVLDQIHVHVVAPKCALSCQEGNILLRKKLFTNVDFLQDTVRNSYILHQNIFTNQKERFIPSVFVNGHIHFSSTVLVEPNSRGMPWQQSWPKEMQVKKSLLALALARLCLPLHQNDGL